MVISNDFGSENKKNPLNKTRRILFSAKRKMILRSHDVQC